MKADLPYYLAQFLSKYLPGEKNASPHTIQSYATTTLFGDASIN